MAYTMFRTLNDQPADRLFLYVGVLLIGSYRAPLQGGWGRYKPGLKFRADLYKNYMAASIHWGGLSVGVLILIVRAVLFGVDFRAPDFWMLPVVRITCQGCVSKVGSWNRRPRCLGFSELTLDRVLQAGFFAEDFRLPQRWRAVEIQLSQFEKGTGYIIIESWLCWSRVCSLAGMHAKGQSSPDAEFCRGSPCMNPSVKVNFSFGCLPAGWLQHVAVKGGSHYW